MSEKKCFADEREICEATTTCDINAAIRAVAARIGDVDAAREAAAKLCPAGGLVVKANRDGTFQVKSGDYHSVTVAATRAGKTRRVIVPMLQSLILADKSNFIINDPKGELLEETGDLLEALGYEVISLDFRHPKNSIGRYNPLSIAWELWMHDEKDRAVDQLMDFAELINFKMSKNTNDAYWPQASIDLFVGLALVMLEAGVSREQFNMGSISAAEAVGSENNFRILKKLCEKNRDARYYEFLSEAAFAPNDTASSIKAVFRSSISRFVGRDGLGDMLAETTCSSKTFIDGRLALFFHVPDESAALSPLVVTILNQLLSSLITLARDIPGRRVPRSIEVVLDEFGNLRTALPDFDLALAAACGHGIHLHLVMQSFSQFDLVYGQAMRRVALDNIEQWVYLGSRSLDTNKYFSEMMGTTRRAPHYQREPVLDVATLQRLERRSDESEAVLLIGSLKPFVAALPDLSRFERVGTVAKERREASKPSRETFDLAGYYKYVQYGDMRTVARRMSKKSEEEELAEFLAMIEVGKENEDDA